MKFILKNVHEKTDFWVLTSDMVSLLEKNSIKYSELSELGKKVNKLTFDEVGSFFLLQSLVLKRLGKPDVDYPIETSNATHAALLKEVITARDDIKQYFIELLQRHNTYFYRRAENGLVLMIADRGCVQSDYPNWTLLKADKLATAIMDTLYNFFGYQDLHFNAVVHTGVNEFTLSNAFYALEQEP